VKAAPAAGALGVDPVATSGGIGAIAGAVSLVWPFFDGMAAALVALAVVGWLTRLLPEVRRGPSAPGPSRRVVSLVLVAVAVGWAYFLLAPGMWSAGRGIALGVAGGCVALVGRRTPPFGEGAE
jgi:hypothetical protein